MDIIERVAKLERAVNGLMYRDRVEKKAAELLNEEFKTETATVKCTERYSKPSIDWRAVYGSSGSGRMMVRGDIVNWESSFSRNIPWVRDDGWFEASDEAVSKNFRTTYNYGDNLCPTRDLQKKLSPRGIDNGTHDRESYLREWWATRHTRGRSEE